MEENEPMSTITRVQAQKIIEAADAVITALAGTNEDVHPESDNMLRLWDDLNDRYAPPEVVRELARIALASLEAEPVAWRRFQETPRDGGYWVFNDYRPESSGQEPLYTAPPAPLSVPDERYQHLSELYHAQEKRLFKLAQRIKGSSFDKYAHSTSQAIDVLESAIFGDSEHTCRAAMLPGADGNSPVVPDGWVACSERMPERDYVLAADFSGKQYPANLPNIQIGIYADWFDDGSPCWDDGDGNDLHLKQVTHWAQIPAAPQQEVK